MSGLEEGIIEPPKKRSRGRNFRQADDDRLCRCWLAVYQHPSDGTGQKPDTFWNRIAEQFNQNATPADPWYRTGSSLQSRWSPLQASIAKFVAIYAVANDVEEALKQFSAQNGKGSGFSHITSWMILKDEPKWLSYSSATVPATAPPTSNPGGAHLPENPSAVPSDAASSVSVERPLPDKTQDENLRQLQAETELKLANAAIERARILRDELTLKFFAMDPDCEESKKYFELKRKICLFELEQQIKGA
uniref:No apical meristem-associated C-terminal domain-containing protein n=1 Tax=Spongospora subterranea TaxID=70186 RepID=A0A0H5RCZ6_9EUKA|eukprot:CRZ11848.1 hypothetical protein [Spongospora subterranea]